MSPLRMNGSTSGNVSLDAPAVAGNNTLILPGGNGTADQALVTNGSGTLSWADRGRMVLGTAQNSTSGTSIDFTGIPSWVKRVTVMFNNVSLNGADSLLVQIGAGSISTSGYASVSGVNNNTGTTSSSGFAVTIGTASLGLYGHLVLTNVSSTLWLSSHQGGLAGGSYSIAGGGAVNLSGSLDRLRVIPTGANSFDAGSINILYEG